MESAQANAVEQLEHLMRELSELWCAGWMSSVEFALWSAVQGSPIWLEQVEISSESIIRARKLSTEINGWVAWLDEWSRPGYLPMDEWLEIYSGYRTSPDFYAVIPRPHDYP